MAGASSTGWNIAVTLGSLLFPCLYPNTQQVQKERVHVSKKLSSVGRNEEVLSEKAGDLRFLKAKWPKANFFYHKNLFLMETKFLKEQILFRFRGMCKHNQNLLRKVRKQEINKKMTLHNLKYKGHFVFDFDDQKCYL
jgi:hypothetical protein